MNRFLIILIATIVFSVSVKAEKSLLTDGRYWIATTDYIDTHGELATVNQKIFIDGDTITDPGLSHKTTPQMKVYSEDLDYPEYGKTLCGVLRDEHGNIYFQRGPGEISEYLLYDFGLTEGKEIRATLYQSSWPDRKICQQPTYLRCVATDSFYVESCGIKYLVKVIEVYYDTLVYNLPPTGPNSKTFWIEGVGALHGLLDNAGVFESGRGYAKQFRMYDKNDVLLFDSTCLDPYLDLIYEDNPSAITSPVISAKSSTYRLNGMKTNSGHNEIVIENGKKIYLP